MINLNSYTLSRGKFVTKTVWWPSKGYEKMQEVQVDPNHSLVGFVFDATENELHLHFLVEDCAEAVLVRPTTLYVFGKKDEEPLRNVGSQDFFIGVAYCYGESTYFFYRNPGALVTW